MVAILSVVIAVLPTCTSHTRVSGFYCASGFSNSAMQRNSCAPRPATIAHAMNTVFPRRNVEHVHVVCYWLTLVRSGRLARVDILQNVIPLVRSKMLYLKFYWHLLCFWLFQFREDVEDVVFRAKHFSRPSIWPWHGKLTWHGNLKMTWQAVIFQWQAVIFQLLPFYRCRRVAARVRFIVAIS